MLGWMAKAHAEQVHVPAAGATDRDFDQVGTRRIGQGVLLQRLGV